jgi:tRNA(fMet)-specific endonuclease VapC
LSPYLLDTNAWIEYLRGRSPKLRQRVASIRPRDVRLCSVVVGELYYGAHKSSRREEDLSLVDNIVVAFDSHPFDEAAAEIFGEIRGLLDSKGMQIGPYDLQIAAIALANRLTLVTHNVAEFRRVPNLSIDDWQA